MVRRKPPGDGGDADGKKPSLPPSVNGPMKHAVPNLKKSKARQQGTSGSGTPGTRGHPPRDPAMDPTRPGWRQVDGGNAPQHIRDTARGYDPRSGGTPRATNARRFAPEVNGQAQPGGARDLTSAGGRDRRNIADDIAYERIPREGGRPYPQAPNVLFEHPEMQLAAEMRDLARRNPGADISTEIVVDNSMCGTRAFDQAKPLTCANLLADVMPAGSRMTVWSTTDGGQTFFQTVVTGTGRLIR